MVTVMQILVSSPLPIASVAVFQNTADARLRHSGTDLLACAYLMGVKN